MVDTIKTIALFILISLGVIIGVGSIVTLAFCWIYLLLRDKSKITEKEKHVIYTILMIIPTIVGVCAYIGYLIVKPLLMIETYFRKRKKKNIENDIK